MERHIICCELSSIMWRVGIIEGKDWLRQIGGKKLAKIGKNCWPNAPHVQTHLWYRWGCYFNSVLCVAKRIPGIKDEGVYGGALYKKWWCCLKEITRDLIYTHFVDKEVGAVIVLGTKTLGGFFFNAGRNQIILWKLWLHGWLWMRLRVKIRIDNGRMKMSCLLQNMFCAGIPFTCTFINGIKLVIIINVIMPSFLSSGHELLSSGQTETWTFSWKSLDPTSTTWKTIFRGAVQHLHWNFLGMWNSRSSRIQSD